ncbi:hypothetical protein [Salipiger aestuarii]|uniref:hypothetical protein n=1 Tax=Salipiger aestuarii TaxID=568098 RepID=UPI0012392E98|nr:hypothetical protein [Salipiger aestuarii]KAA8616040.1 hypothetical protein AL037_02085 [Salipiger aestuarii]
MADDVFCFRTAPHGHPLVRLQERTKVASLDPEGARPLAKTFDIETNLCTGAVLSIREDSEKTSQRPGCKQIAAD